MKRISSKRLSSETISERLLSINSAYRLASEYVHSEIPVTLQCTRCNTERQAYLRKGIAGLPFHCDCILLDGVYRIPTRIEKLNHMIVENNPKNTYRVIGLSDHVKRGDIECIQCGKRLENIILNNYTSGKCICQCAKPDAKLKNITEATFLYRLSNSGSTFKYVEGYTGFLEPCAFQCELCNKSLITWPQDILVRGRECTCQHTVLHRGASKAQIAYLDQLAEENDITIKHIENSSEYKAPQINQKFDGYCKELDLLIEYHGSVFHGNPRMFAPDEYCHPFDRTVTAGELYQGTLAKDANATKLGYSILSIWDDEIHFDISKAAKPNLGDQFTFLDPGRQPNFELILATLSESDFIIKPDEYSVFWKYWDGSVSATKDDVQVVQVLEKKLVIFKDIENNQYMAPLSSFVDALFAKAA